jgi:hypothetical protein
MDISETKKAMIYPREKIAGAYEIYPISFSVHNQQVFSSHILPEIGSGENVSVTDWCSVT